VQEVGCAIIGQTADLAPADKRVYAIRDVTATVESIPLITASILSKKLAAGLDCLVMDVKTGSGAFMQKLEDSRALAQSLVEVANGAGLTTSALITDMSEPLATAAGNAVEVQNAVDFLSGRQIDRRLWDVTVALGGEVLATAGIATSAKEGRTKIEAAFTSGKAAELFNRMSKALGGPSDIVDHPENYLKPAPVVRDIFPAESGKVTAIDTRAVGIAVVELGGGRTRAADPIDHSVGFTALAGLGATVNAKTPLAKVHARDEAAIARATESLRAAYTIGEGAPKSREVYERIGP
jgi:thymidine phosphorylase